MFKLDKINDLLLYNLSVKSLSAYRHAHKDVNWEVSLNDQDVFNILLLYDSQYFMVLDCAWNVQFHARLNSFIQCYPELLLNDYGVKFSNGEDMLRVLNDHTITIDMIPVECEASNKAQIFVCSKRPKVLHFMAQSYKENNYCFANYYCHFWQSYVDLSWHILIGY